MTEEQKKGYEEALRGEHGRRGDGKQKEAVLLDGV